MIALRLSPETPLTPGQAADGAGSDELGKAHSRRPRRRLTPAISAPYTKKLDNLSMNDYLLPSDPPP